MGQNRRNAFDLFDMHGNVWEWCWDGYDERYYVQSPVDDPSGPLKASGRVIRGGGWGTIPRHSRSAYRSGYTPDYRDFILGFRLARSHSGSR